MTARNGVKMKWRKGEINQYQRRQNDENEINNIENEKEIL